MILIWSNEFKCCYFFFSLLNKCFQFLLHIASCPWIWSLFCFVKESNQVLEYNDFTFVLFWIHFIDTNFGVIAIIWCRSLTRFRWCYSSLWFYLLAWLHGITVWFWGGNSFLGWRRGNKCIAENLGNRLGLIYAQLRSHRWKLCTLLSGFLINCLPRLRCDSLIKFFLESMVFDFFFF